MICDICGTNEAKIKHISRIYGKGKDSFIIENIPFVSCNHCRESYLTAETLKEIYRIKKQKASLFKTKEYQVAQFV